MRISIRQLRQSTKEVMNTVMRGEKVIITVHGHPSAELTPVRKTIKKSTESDQLFGLWADHPELESVEDYIRNIRKPRYDG